MTYKHMFLGKRSTWRPVKDKEQGNHRVVLMGIRYGHNPGLGTGGVLTVIKGHK